MRSILAVIPNRSGLLSIVGAVVRAVLRPWPGLLFVLPGAARRGVRVCRPLGRT